MRYLILLLFVVSGATASAQTAALKNAAASLDKALVAKDTVTLNKILHKSLSYGHSNGWVQTKEDVVTDLASGKLIYKKIDTGEAKWETGSAWASMRCTADVTYELNGKEGILKLHVLQVWIKKGKGWQLMARQSIKL